MRKPRLVGHDQGRGGGVLFGRRGSGEASSHGVSEPVLSPPGGGHWGASCMGPGAPPVPHDAGPQDLPRRPGHPAHGCLQLETPLEGVTGTQTPRDGQGFICNNVTSTHTSAGDTLMLL